MPGGFVDRAIAGMLRVRWVVRLPIPLYRSSLGWMLGSRLLMLEHLGRTSGRRRFVVLEVLARERNLVRVASGLGPESDWYRNLRANGVAYISTGRFRRVRARARLLDAQESRAKLEEYAREHGRAWRVLESAMAEAQGHEPHIPVVEFLPPLDWSGWKPKPGQTSTSPRS